MHNSKNIHHIGNSRSLQDSIQGDKCPRTTHARTAVDDDGSDAILGLNSLTECANKLDQNLGRVRNPKIGPSYEMEMLNEACLVSLQ